MRLENIKAGRKGNLNVATEVHEAAAVYLLVSNSQINVKF